MVFSPSPSYYDEEENRFYDLQITRRGSSIYDRPTYLQTHQVCSNGRTTSEMNRHSRAELITEFAAKLILAKSNGKELETVADFDFKEPLTTEEIKECSKVKKSEECLHLVMDFDPTKSKEEGWKLTLFQNKA